MVEVVCTADYDIPIRGRAPEHYLHIFPEVFPNKPGQKILIIGPGFSNISLGEGVIGIDPVFANLKQAQTHLDYQSAGSREVGSINNIISYIKHVKSGENKNSHLVAGEVSADVGLPFPFLTFKSVVSNNCIFGGIDYFEDSEQIYQMLERVAKHVSPQGAIYLYPHFTQQPQDLSWPQDNEFEAELYLAAFHTQLQVLTKLDHKGYKITSSPSRIRENKIPAILNTVKIAS